MLFKKLGKSDTIVPVIGQGTADIGKYNNGSISDEYNIRYGIDNGLNFIDTAESYSNGLSEIIVGKAIRGIRDKVILSTKIKPENLRYNNVISSAENSLKRMNVDIIDLYQIHWPNINIDISETMMAFEKLYKDGKIKYVGVSNFLPMEMEPILCKNYCFNWIVSNQIEYNLYDRFAERYILPYCYKNDISIICYCPLNRGEIVQNNKKTILLQGLANKYGKTIYQISLNWLVFKNGVIAIPFSSNLEHIKQNAESVDFILDKEDVELIDNEICGEIEYCDVNDIQVIEGGFGNHDVYHSIEEAIENKFNLSPSPVDLSVFFLKLTEEQINMIKPIRAVLSKDSVFKYSLIEGRVRYWGWVLAFGNKKNIPLYIIDKD